MHQVFEFVTTPRVVFGPGVFAGAGEIARSLGRRAFIVTGQSRARADRLISILEPAGVECEVFSGCGEPSIETVAAGREMAKSSRAEVIIAIGGGSALDSGKAIAALAANDGDVFDYLETIGRARPLERRALPVVAIPTTAGTGSEVTRNAVLTSAEHRVKVSLRHMSMLPRVAIVDPELSVGLPSDVTATTGLDALTQLIEPFVSLKHTPVVDALAIDGMGRAAVSLRAAVSNGSDIAARSNMALAALLSGMALSNAALGAVHGLAGPLGGLLGAPHGALCAALLPHVMTVNITALRRNGDDSALARYEHIARIVTGRSVARADEGAEWVRDLVKDLSVPGLGAYGLTRDGIAQVIEPARRASSMKGNPVELSSGELTEILEKAR